MNADVSLAGAFLAGLISFLSPCVLPLVPGYISMLSGVGMEQLRGGEIPSSRLLASALSFVGGLSVVFITLGASASALGQLLKANRNSLTPIAGAIVLLFGLQLLGVLVKLSPRVGMILGTLLAATGVYSVVRHAPLFAGFGALHFFSLSLIGFFGPSLARWLNRDVHLRASAAQPSTWSAFLLGAAFAFGWSPCLGPIVGLVLGLATVSGTLARGVLLLAVYSAGLAVPFLLTALEMTRFLKFYQSFRKYLHAVEVFSGALLLFIGALVFTNKLAWLTAKLSFLNVVTGWLERLLTGNHHGLVFWLLVGLAIAAIVALAVVRYWEVFSSMQGKKTAFLLMTVVALVIGTYFADKATRVKATGPERNTEQTSAKSGIQPAPAVTFKNLDGADVTLAQYQGTVVLVNFWATWCDPCYIEIPWLIEMQQKYAAKGFTILGVSMDEEGKAAVVPFLAKERFNVNGQKLPMNYPIVIGNDDVADKFGGLLGYPTTFLISKDGKIVTKVQGLISYDELTKEIEAQL
jgi:cytochrome c-type biogenesis protein